MNAKAMSLKAKIRNLARKNDMSAQVVLQNFMFERFLERISHSEYRNKFILKGGVLISSLVGIDNRSTMDLDATIKNYPVNAIMLTKAIKDICSIALDDDVSFLFSAIDPIREDDIYGGFRVSIMAEYDTITTRLQVDITTGDAITPKEVLYLFKMLFQEDNFSIWAYNIETILAEKVETILRRGELNTRPRDFYDVYILVKTQPFDVKIFEDALKSTAGKRGTNFIFKDINRRLNEISRSEPLRHRWSNYKRNYRYADGIQYDDIIDAIRFLVQYF